MSRRVLLSAAVLLWFALPRGALAALILDQVYEATGPSATAYVFGPTPPTFPSIFQETAQTFTAGQSGTLARIDVRIRTRGVAPGDLVLELQETVSGAPGGTALGSVSLTRSEIGTLTTPAFVSFDVTSLGVGVLAGSEIAIVLRSLDSTLGDDYGFNGDSTAGYAGGEAFLRGQGTGLWESWENGGIDFGFRAYLVPEPSTGALLAAGVALLGAARRRT